MCDARSTQSPKVSVQLRQPDGAAAEEPEPIRKITSSIPR
jgi:hypothetical protein